MEFDFLSSLGLIANVISFISIAIIVWGVFVTFVKFFLIIVNGKFHDNKAAILLDLRITLGSYILLGLEVLIAADIIESVAHRTLDEVLLLIAIVIIRTAISYFLNKEIEAVEKAKNQK
ncbi:MAG: DUF1622 domain-containing protein [Culicoidibacterales bacterium]